MPDAAWLAGLRVGDKVAVRARRGIGVSETYRIYTVKHITPKRTRFDLGVGEDQVTSFDKHGSRDLGKWNGSDYLEPVTDEVRAAIKRYRVLSRVSDFDGWEHLPIDTLSTIAGFIEAYQEEKERTQPKAV